MNKNKHKIKMFADKRLLLMGTILTLSYTVMFFLVINMSNESLEGVVFAFIWWIGVFLCFPRWFANITLDSRGILFKAPFKKTKYTEYERYGYIYCASYSHFGIPVRYVVVSQIKLSDYQLTHINSVPQSYKTIKILLNKDNKTKLEAIFPKWYISQLNKQGYNKNNTGDDSVIDKK